MEGSSRRRKPPIAKKLVFSARTMKIMSMVKPAIEPGWIPPINDSDGSSSDSDYDDVSSPMCAALGPLSSSSDEEFSTVDFYEVQPAPILLQHFQDLEQLTPDPPSSSVEPKQPVPILPQHLQELEQLTPSLPPSSTEPELLAAVLPQHLQEHEQLTPNLPPPSVAPEQLTSTLLLSSPAFEIVHEFSPIALNASPSIGRVGSAQSTPMSLRGRKQKADSKTPEVVAKKKPRIMKPKKLPKLDFKFTHNDCNFRVDLPPSDDFECPPSMRLDIDYFLQFFSEKMIEDLAYYSNLYSVQNTGKSINTNKDEMKKFLGMELLMGVVAMPAYTDYWSLNLRYGKIADVMPLKRYEALRRNIHYNDHTKQDDDPFFKVRKLFEDFRKNCLSVKNEKAQSIDEMMVPYKGKKAGKKKQYIKSKPKKWGIKVFARCGSSGFVYDLILYSGSDTFKNYSVTPTEENMGFGAKVVLCLCQTIDEKPMTVVYFDNYFSSLTLLSWLRKQYGILAVGTIRSNRIHGAGGFLAANKKSPRGSCSQVVDQKNQVVVAKWIDNKEVLLASNFVDCHPTSTVLWYSKEEKKKVPIQCPQIIKQYNTHMGGVDLMDMMVSLYRCDMRTKRWYNRMFAQIVDIAVNNAWLIKRREYLSLFGEPLPEGLKKFKTQLAEILIQPQVVPVAEESPASICKPVAPRPNAAIRFDNLGHFPVYDQQRGRCRYCKNGQSFWKCRKCTDVRLCLTSGRNCFVLFHAPQ